jgi:hypothetical protein
MLTYAYMYVYVQELQNMVEAKEGAEAHARLYAGALEQVGIRMLTYADVC